MRTDLPSQIIIGMQQAMASPAAGPRNNPDAWHRIATLPRSLFWPRQPGVEFQAPCAPLDSEHVVEKTAPTH